MTATSHSDSLLIVIMSSTLTNANSDNNRIPDLKSVFLCSDLHIAVTYIPAYCASCL